MTAQIEHGRQTFQQPVNGVACSNCHELDGVGTAVGPDLTKIAKYGMPAGLATAIKMSMTVYVEQIRTGKNTFPGYVKEKTADNEQIWDLSQQPPALRTLQANEIAKRQQNEKWRHPPAQGGYTPQQLADVIAFLKWASTGKAIEVNPDSLPLK